MSVRKRDGRKKRAMVEWLEVPENFRLIVGAASETKKQVVAGKNRIIKCFNILLSM
jgi:hypothetical protein